MIVIVQIRKHHVRLLAARGRTHRLVLKHVTRLNTAHDADVGGAFGGIFAQQVKTRHKRPHLHDRRLFFSSFGHADVTTGHQTWVVANTLMNNGGIDVIVWLTNSPGCLCSIPRQSSASTTPTRTIFCLAGRETCGLALDQHGLCFGAVHTSKESRSDCT